MREGNIRAIETVGTNDLACERESASLANGVSKGIGSAVKVKDSSKLKMR